MTPKLDRLNLKHLLFIIIAFSSAMASADQAATAGLACSPIYKKTIYLTKSVLGESKDDVLAPAINEFLADYTKSYIEVPSFETYRERLEKNNFEGDNTAAYNFMQNYGREEDEKKFNKVMSVITAIEKFAGPLSGMAEPLDENSIAYAKCLRDYMAKTLRNLPGNSYYDYKRSELLRKIELPIAGQSTQGAQSPAEALQ